MEWIHAQLEHIFLMQTLLMQPLQNTPAWVCSVKGAFKV